MTPIITLTFNPCIDKSFSTELLIPDQKLPCTLPSLEPGGGGINVARAIRRLGGSALAVFPAGGYHGDLLVSLLSSEQVAVKPIRIDPDTRENLNVTETSTGRQFRFLLPGPPLSAGTWNACIESISEVEPGGFVVVSGSIPDGSPGDLFARIRKMADTKRARLVVDSSGAALQQALQCGVYMLKPSIHELDLLDKAFGLPGETIIDKGKELIKRGCASVVLVSAGAAGAILITADLVREIPSPRVKRATTVGAGDCLVAGTVLGLSRNMPIAEATLLGVAAAAASVMNPGTFLCRPEDVDTLFTQMKGSKEIIPL